MHSNKWNRCLLLCSYWLLVLIVLYLILCRMNSADGIRESGREMKIREGEGGKGGRHRLTHTHTYTHRGGEKLLKRVFAPASLSIAQFLQEAAASGSPLAPMTRYDLHTSQSNHSTLSWDLFILFAWIIKARLIFMDFSNPN